MIDIKSASTENIYRPYDKSTLVTVSKMNDTLSNSK